MTIEAIAAMSAIGGVADANGISDAKFLPTMAAAQTPGNFATWFAQEVNAVNQKLTVADNDMIKLASGEAPSLHEVMIHLEEAKLSFQLLAQVRNRLLDAYQEVMRMQV